MRDGGGGVIIHVERRGGSILFAPWDEPFLLYTVLGNTFIMDSLPCEVCHEQHFFMGVLSW